MTFRVTQKTVMIEFVRLSPNQLVGLINDVAVCLVIDDPGFQMGVWKLKKGGALILDSYIGLFDDLHAVEAWMTGSFEGQFTKIHRIDYPLYPEDAK